MKQSAFMAKHRDFINKTIDLSTKDETAFSEWFDNLGQRELAILIIVAHGLRGWGEFLLANIMATQPDLGEFGPMPPEDL